MSFNVISGTLASAKVTTANNILNSIQPDINDILMKVRRKIFLHTLQ